MKILTHHALCNMAVQSKRREEIIMLCYRVLSSAGGSYVVMVTITASQTISYSIFIIAIHPTGLFQLNLKTVWLKNFKYFTEIRKLRPIFWEMFRLKIWATFMQFTWISPVLFNILTIQPKVFNTMNGGLNKFAVYSDIQGWCFLSF